MQRRVRVPATVVISVAIAVFGSATDALASAIAIQRDSNLNDGELMNLIRWQMFSHGTALASTLLLAGALFGIANRLSRWQRTIVLIAAWLHVVWLAWSCARPVLFELIDDPALMELLTVWVWRLMGLATFAAIVLLTIAARAWWRPYSAFVVVAAVVLVVLELVPWAPYLSTWIHSLRTEHRLVYQAIWPLREILSDGAFLVVIHALMRDTTEPLPDLNGATSWFRRAEASIIVRIVAAVLLALVGLSNAPGAIKLVLVVGPMIAVACMLAFGWCMLAVERAAISDMPRIRFLLGGTIAAWLAGIQLLQATSAYNMLRSDAMRNSFDTEAATMWTIIGPLIGIVGMVLVCSAIARFALIRGNHALRERAISRAIILAVLQVIVMLMPFALAKLTSVGMMIILSLTLAGMAIAALVMLAGLMRQAADAIGTAPELPVARLRS